MAVVDWLLPPTQVGRAIVILVAALAILAAVWLLQGIGYAPCELCLTERYAFYANVAAGGADGLAGEPAVVACGGARPLRPDRADLSRQCRPLRLPRRRRAALVAGSDRLHWRTERARARQRPFEAVERRPRRQVRRGAVARARPVARRLGRRRLRGVGALCGARGAARSTAGGPRCDAASRIGGAAMNPVVAGASF